MAEVPIGCEWGWHRWCPGHAAGSEQRSDDKEGGKKQQTSMRKEIKLAVSETCTWGDFRNSFTIISKANCERTVRYFCSCCGTLAGCLNWRPNAACFVDTVRTSAIWMRLRSSVGTVTEENMSYHASHASGTVAQWYATYCVNTRPWSKLELGLLLGYHLLWTGIAWWLRFSPLTTGVFCSGCTADLWITWWSDAQSFGTSD